MATTNKGTVISFGEITVPAPGTPVQVTDDTELRAHAMRFEALEKNTKMTHVGFSNLAKASGDGVILRVAAPSGGSATAYDRTTLPAEGFGNAAAGNPFRPSDIYVDAEIANEGLLVTALVF